MTKWVVGWEKKRYFLVMFVVSLFILGTRENCFGIIIQILILRIALLSQYKDVFFD